MTRAYHPEMDQGMTDEGIFWYRFGKDEVARDNFISLLPRLSFWERRAIEGFTFVGPVEPRKAGTPPESWSGFVIYKNGAPGIKNLRRVELPVSAPVFPNNPPQYRSFFD